MGGKIIKLVKPVWLFLQVRETVRSWIQTKVLQSARGLTHSIAFFSPCLWEHSLGFSIETGGDSHGQSRHSETPP